MVQICSHSGTNQLTIRHIPATARGKSTNFSTPRHQVNPQVRRAACTTKNTRGMSNARPLNPPKTSYSPMMNVFFFPEQPTHFPMLSATLISCQIKSNKPGYRRCSSCGSCTFSSTFDYPATPAKVATRVVARCCQKPGGGARSGNSSWEM